MKKFVLILIILATFSTTQTARAQMMNFYQNQSSPATEDDKSQNLDSLVNEVMQQQGVKSKDEIDCQKLSQGQLEDIGDAWMDNHLGSSAAHEQMDKMMGGEGSESLRQAHIRMGESYLNCPGKGGGFPMMYGWGDMMNWGGLGVFGILGSLVWLVILVDLVLLGVWLWKQIQKR